MKSTRSILLFLIAWCTWAFAIPATATPAITGIDIDGNVVTATLELTSLIEAELTLTFEDAVGLSASNLGWSIDQIDSLEAAALLTRMPSSVTLPTALPLLLAVEPPSTGGLSFSGVVEIELYTHNLTYSAFSALRLFAAPASGDFVDITTDISSGSYRARGTKGSFSEFLIVLDARSVDTVIGVKFDRLENLLTTYSAALDDTLESDLNDWLDDAETFYAADNLVSAIQKVEKIEKEVDKASSSEAPDVWRSARDLDNVAGEIRAAADTLRFSLVLADNGAP